MLKFAVPIFAMMMIARPIMNLINGIRSFSQQTMQVKNQLDTISQQIETASNRFTFPQFGAANHKSKQDKAA
jgi:CBS domain containing-hemolysin-like protein